MLDAWFKPFHYALATMPLLVVLHWEIHEIAEEQKAASLIAQQILAKLEEREGEEGNQKQCMDYQQLLADAEEK